MNALKWLSKICKCASSCAFIYIQTEIENICIYIEPYMARTSFAAYLLPQKRILAAEIQGFGPRKILQKSAFF